MHDFALQPVRTAVFLPVDRIVRTDRTAGTI